MNQGDVLDTTIEGEGDFNFSQWITENELTDIKHLFIKYNVTKRSSLTITSSEFQSLLKDAELLQKPYLFPTVMSAIAAIPALHTQNDESYTKIVVYAEEQAVIDEITKNMKILQDKAMILNEMKVKYDDSIKTLNTKKLTKIKESRTKIDTLFVDINNAVQIRKQTLLKTLEDIENSINKEEKPESEGMDENKENDILLIAMEKLKEEQEFISIQLNECKKMIEPSNHDNIEERKENILKIGQDAANKLNETYKALNDNMEIIQNMIDKNKNDVINIDYMYNDKTYKKILNKVNNLGSILNEQSSQKPLKSIYCEDDDDDITIDKLQKDVQKYESIILSLETAIQCADDEILELKNRINDYEKLEELFNKREETIKDVTNKLNESQRELKEYMERINELNNTLDAHNTKYDKFEKQLIESLSFEWDSQHRWYFNNDIEQKTENENGLIGKINDADCINIIFSNGKSKKRISRKYLSLTPRNNDINHLCDLVAIFKMNITENILKNMSAPPIKYVDVLDCSWDTKYISNKWSISWFNQNEITFTGSDYNDYGTAFLSHSVDEGEHQWTFQINGYSEGTTLIFGIFNNAYNLKSNMYTYLGYYGESSYGFMANQAQLSVFGKDDEWTYPDSYGVRCNQGSIIKMFVNYFNLTLSFNIDGKEYGKAFNIKDKQYTPAISTNYYANSIELIKYQKME